MWADNNPKTPWINTEDDLLTEDDIILLDNETSSFEDIKEEIEE